MADAIHPAPLKRKTGDDGVSHENDQQLACTTVGNGGAGGGGGAPTQPGKLAKTVQADGNVFRAPQGQTPAGTTDGMTDEQLKEMMRQAGGKEWFSRLVLEVASEDQRQELRTRLAAPASVPSAENDRSADTSAEGDNQPTEPAQPQHRGRRTPKKTKASGTRTTAPKDTYAGRARRAAAGTGPTRNGRRRDPTQRQRRSGTYSGAPPSKGSTTAQSAAKRTGGVQRLHIRPQRGAQFNRRLLAMWVGRLCASKEYDLYVVQREGRAVCAFVTLAFPEEAQDALNTVPWGRKGLTYVWPNWTVRRALPRGKAPKRGAQQQRGTEAVDVKFTTKDGTSLHWRDVRAMVAKKVGRQSVRWVGVPTRQRRRGQWRVTIKLQNGGRSRLADRWTARRWGYDWLVEVVTDRQEGAAAGDGKGAAAGDGDDKGATEKPDSSRGSAEGDGTPKPTTDGNDNGNDNGLDSRQEASGAK